MDQSLNMHLKSENIVVGPHKMGGQKVMSQHKADPYNNEKSVLDNFAISSG